MIRRACAEADEAEGAAADIVPDARRAGGVDTAADADAFNGVLPAGDEDGETRGRLLGEEAARIQMHNDSATTVSRVLALAHCDSSFAVFVLLRCLRSLCVRCVSTCSCWCGVCFSADAELLQSDFDGAGLDTGRTGCTAAACCWSGLRSVLR